MTWCVWIEHALVAKKQITEETLQIYRCIVNPFLGIFIIGAYQRIAEILFYFEKYKIIV